MKLVWITWERHRRTIELSLAIPHTDLHELVLDGLFPPVRYLLLLLRTAIVLLKCRPRIVVVQNPSLILTSFALIASRLIKFRLIVDAHNEGVIPFSENRRWLLPIYQIIQRGTDLTIVTNYELAKIVERNGGRAFVLEDKIPHFSDPKKINLKGDKNALLVCTFEKDEPYAEVIKAAALIDPTIFIYITGPYSKAPIHIVEHAPSNVIFTGFIPDEDYVDLFYSCDVIIDLTLMDNCLVCGAYEAVSLGKPVILSDTKALRDYFYKGIVYTRNSSTEIAKSICYALENKERLTKQSSLLNAELAIDWNEKFDCLVSKLHELAEPSPRG